MSDHVLTTRAATPRDANTLGRLAVLASHPRPRGHALLAERDGVAIAAISLTSGLVLADPSSQRADAGRALRYRRYRLLRQGGDAGTARSLLRRVAPAA
jgi:hypothetical protein